MKTVNNYINIRTTDKDVPSFTDPTLGKETAQNLIDKGCDVGFAMGGNTTNGALLAAKENSVVAVRAGVDEHSADPEVQSALTSSAMKDVDVAVYSYLKTVADGSVRAGISTCTLQNGGVGLTPLPWLAQQDPGQS